MCVYTFHAQSFSVTTLGGIRVGLGTTKLLQRVIHNISARLLQFSVTPRSFIDTQHFVGHDTLNSRIINPVFEKFGRLANRQRRSFKKST
jgi:hypothetical protein